MNTKNRQFSYDVIRTFAILFVTFNHAINRSFSNYGAQYLDFERYSFFSNLFKASVTVLSHIGVPLFLMLTGSLILSKPFDTAEQRKYFYRHNWLRILITTEIWLAIAFWFIYFFSPDPLLRSYSIPKLITNFLLNQVFFEQRALGSMWYMNMIIPIYTLLPMIALYIQHGNGKSLIAPCFIVFISSFVIPFVNSVFALTGVNHELHFALNTSNVFSLYLIYILLGAFFSRNNQTKFSLRTLLVIWIAVFVGCVAFQLFAYKSTQEYLLDYDSVLILVLSAITFDLLRRLSNSFVKVAQFVTYTSKISFGFFSFTL